MKTIFLSFGGPSTNYHEAVERITQQAREFDSLFDTVLKYTDLDLKNDAEFWSKHGAFLENNQRGYGYWLWKSYLNYKTISEADNDDIIIYVDAGCELFPEYKSRLEEYIDMAKTNPHGIVAFSIPFPEGDYTKMDVAEHLDCHHHMDSDQIIATTFIYRKCAHTENIMKQWYDTCSIYHLLDDTPSSIHNRSPSHGWSFDSRHDQSIFSLLLKKYGCALLGYEVDPKERSPIIKMNNRTGIKSRICRDML